MSNSPHSAASIPNPGKKYAPVGHCIWCWPRLTPPSGDEHIIPLSFGGNLLLPRASCRRCEKITTKFEAHCLVGMLETARFHLGLQGRNKIKKRDRLPIRFATNDGVAVVSVDAADHPSALLMPVLGPPLAMLGLSIRASGPYGIRVSITPLSGDFQRRVGGRRVQLTRGLAALPCYKLLAKIAHAYTVAELGANTFAPTVLRIVRDAPAVFGDYYIGSFTLDEPAANQLHVIGFDKPIRDKEGEWIVVKIRIFAHIAGLPTYYVISGRRHPGLTPELLAPHSADSTTA